MDGFAFSGQGHWGKGEAEVRVAAKKNALTPPPVMALACILVLAGWTGVVLGDLAIPGAAVEDLKQKIAPVPVTKVGPAPRPALGADVAAGVCARVGV